VSGVHVPLGSITHRIFLSLAIWAIAVVLWAPRPTTESVRAELIRRQQETGLTFAWLDEPGLPWTNRSVQAVVFETRDVVVLKDSVEAFSPDGFSIKEYQENFAIGECWSHDQTKLAATMMNHSTGRLVFGILDLKSKQVHAIAINADQKAYVTSQCWSKDDKELVYQLEGAVRLYSVENDRADAIAKGTDPSWSPDGEWIGFRDGDTYYVMHAHESLNKELFRNRWGKAVSALYWSPDSRIVAYVRELGFLQGGALDAEFNELRVRRLEDGSDDRMCNENANWYSNYHWITSKGLRSELQQRKSPSK